jgi:DNA-binding CsgD family transcriptional regulator
MATLHELHHITSRSNEFNKMVRSVAPLSDCYGVNHFFYYRIVSNFFYGVGTHLKWHEFYIDNIDLMSHAHTTKHSNILKSEIVLFKSTSDPSFKELLNTAWNKFNINLTINVQREIKGGIEGFGFGVKSNHVKADQHLLNHLPLLNKFVDYFTEKNSKLINIAKESQVDIASLLGKQFYKKQSEYPMGGSKKNLQKQLGLLPLEALTRREIEVIKFLAQGYPAKYIAEQLHISHRTVENYIATIKSKLNCDSKSSLIEKSRDHSLFLN